MITLDVELKSDKGSELIELVEEKYGLGITNENLEFLSHYTTGDATILTFKANVIDRGRYDELIEKERKFDKLLELVGEVLENG